MEKTDIFKILSILALLILNIYLFINSRSLNCESCQINFYSNTEVDKRISDVPNQDFTENITDLFKSFEKGECLVKWSEENGYFHKNIKANI